MALPQTVDPTSLNLSGKPAIATAPTTTTSVGATGMPMPRVAMEKNEIPLGAGALLGYAFGNLMGNKGSSSLTGNQANQNANQNANQPANPKNPSGNTPTGGTPTGNIGSVNSIKFPAGTTQDQIDEMINPLTGQKYGKTNGQSNYVVSGVNMHNGEVVALPNDKIGGTNLGTNTGNFGFEAGTGSGGTTGGTTPIGNQYFQDSSGNVYDSEGTLIYYNPSPTGSGTIDSGSSDTGSDTSGFFQNAQGDIYDNTGSLVLEYGNGYYYEPDTGNYYDSNFDVVDDSFSFFKDFMGLPTYGGSDNYDYGNLSDYFNYGDYTSGSTTYIKDGGSVRGGLATPLFRNGGSVPRFADGSTGGIDLSKYTNTGDPLANTNNLLGVDNTVNSSNFLGVNTPVATQSNLTNPAPDSNTSGSGVMNTISNLLGNKGVSGALLGTLIAQLLNSTEQPVNKGVDMTALGTLKPRTTPTGAARFVPYSEYGTPTTQNDYSQLYQNLGVSPFNGAPAPTNAPPPPPTGGLSAMPSTMSPTGTVTTPPTTSTAPQYFQDADGNIYNGNGDLVYDTTTSSLTPTAQTSVASSPLMATSQTASAPMSGLAVTTPEASSSYYSYGSDVNPSQVLSSKNGGAVKRFADGGLSDLAVSSLDEGDNLDMNEYFRLISKYPGFQHLSDPSFHNKTTYDSVRMIDPNYIGFGNEGHLLDVEPELAKFYANYVRTPPPYNPNSYEALMAGANNLPSDINTPIAYENQTVGGGDLPFDVSTNSAQNDGAINNDFPDDFPIRTMMGDTPLPYERVTTTNAPSALPSFSSSPTFRLSGANNPLLTGLRQGPVQQPFMLMPDGTFAPREELSTSRQYAQGGSPHGNPNLPMSGNHNPNVPTIEGRQDYREGAYVQGAGDGQSDDIPAMLADGEYVIDAETVAQLGNGSNKAGAKILDGFRENIRSHKRNTPLNKIPPKSKSPLAYLKGAK